MSAALLGRERVRRAEHPQTLGSMNDLEELRDG